MKCNEAGDYNQKQRCRELIMEINKAREKEYVDITLDYYDVNAESFCFGTQNAAFSEHQDTFLSYLPPQASILDRSKQPFRIGMVPAAVKDIAQRSVLHNLPGIDDGHLVTRLRNHPQIMGNHDYAGFVFSLKVTDRSYRNPEPILSRPPPDFQKRVRPSGISHCLKPMWTLA